MATQTTLFRLNTHDDTGARLVVDLTEDGIYIIDTWLPGGTIRPVPIPEWRDYAATIEDAHVIWKKQRDELLARGYRPVIGT